MRGMTSPQQDQPQPTPAPSEGVIQVQHEGRTYQIFHPNVGKTAQYLRELLQGGEYPLLPLPGYEPATIVDIGANVGGAALRFHCAYPKARVLAYEPSAVNFGFLRRNLGSEPGVSVFGYGLSDKAEQLKLYRGADTLMQNSVLRNEQTSDEFELVELKRASDEFRRQAIERVDILKVDTEGCEFVILADLEPWLDKTDIIYLEYHHEDDRLDIDRLLSKHFALAWSQTPHLHRGISMYLSYDLQRRYPQLGGRTRKHSRFTYRKPQARDSSSPAT